MFNIIACQLFVHEQSTSTQVIQQLYKYKNQNKTTMRNTRLIQDT